MSKKSVIFRGSILFPKHPENFIKSSIKTLRTWFDGEVIVSTWKGQENHLLGIDGIDKIVTTIDPGEGPIQNFKRQIISYERGVEESTGDYILVTRTDIEHRKDIFQHMFSYPNYNYKFKLLDDKLLIGNMMSINPESSERPNTYRLCDWFHLGKRQDIIDWGFLSTFFEKKNNFFGCTEKTWFIYFLIKKGILPNNAVTTSSIDGLFWDFVLNNFVIMNTKSTLESFNRNWDFQPEKLECYLTEEIYSKLYKKYDFNFS